MRFGDVQDTRKKDTGCCRKETCVRKLEKKMEALSAINRSGRMVAVFGVTFTI